jgi:glucose-1-phosphate adenylyltransferase
MVQQPPARFVFSADDRRAGVAIDSIVSAGCVIEGGRLTRSILSPGVRVRGYCEIDGSVLMSNCDIGRYSRIRRAIIPPDVIIPENSTIGYNREDDIRHGYTVTPENVVVVPPPESDFREVGSDYPQGRIVGSAV